MIWQDDLYNVEGHQFDFSLFDVNDCVSKVKRETADNSSETQPPEKFPLHAKRTGIEATLSTIFITPDNSIDVAFKRAMEEKNHESIYFIIVDFFKTLI